MLTVGRKLPGKEDTQRLKKYNHQNHRILDADNIKQQYKRSGSNWKKVQDYSEAVVESKKHACCYQYKPG